MLDHIVHLGGPSQPTRAQEASVDNSSNVEFLQVQTQLPESASGMLQICQLQWRMVVSCRCGQNLELAHTIASHRFPQGARQTSKARAGTAPDARFLCSDFVHRLLAVWPRTRQWTSPKGQHEATQAAPTSAQSEQDSIQVPVLVGGATDAQQQFHRTSELKRAIWCLILLGKTAQKRYERKERQTQC